MALRRIDDTTDAAGILDTGGVLLLATDTLPGLHARVDRPEALAQLQIIKGRAEGKPLIVLAASLEQVERVAVFDGPRQRAYAGLCWPGPFSLILDACPDLATEVTAGGSTVAVRVPDVVELSAFLAAVGAPLASSSANRAGEEPALVLADAAGRFETGVAGFWTGVPDGGGASSAVVDLTVWPPRVLRAGPRPAPDPEALDGAGRGA